MSVATRIPYMKLGHRSTPCCTSSCSSSSTSPSLSFSPIIRNKYSSFTVRSSQAEGPLRRPVASPVRQPSSPSPQPPNPAPIKPPSPTVAQQIPMAVAAPGQATGVVTLEFQRQKAKELQEFFKQKKLEEADQGPFFGFIGKNEISNGRWAMFGFAVGMLTEYATGSDFVDQIKILLSNFGILDLE